MSAPDAVIVGGGFAGLSAGAMLAARGLRVLVLDARPQLGGRATAFADKATGELVDNGQHVLFGCYRATFEFLRRIGAEDNVRAQPALALTCYDQRGRRSMLRCPPLPAPLHLLAAVLDWDPIPWKDRLSALRLAVPLAAARRALVRGGTIPPGPARETVSDWLRRYHQGAKLVEWLWEPLAVAALNQPPEEAAAAPFVRVLAEMFGPDPSAAAVVLPMRPLNQMYAEPARAYIERHGGEVRAGALARVIVEEGKAAGVEIRGERVPAARVIAAVPWHALRRLFWPAVPAALERTVAAADAMTSKPIVTVNLWYDRTVMQEPFVGLPGRTIQWVFDKRLAFGEEASHLSLVSSGADAIVHHDDERLIALAAAEVEDGIPGVRGARLVRGTVIREKRATFSLSPDEPLRPDTETDGPGLFLAGDWIDTGLPGTIESAVVSGHRAAAALLNDAGAVSPS